MRDTLSNKAETISYLKKQGMLGASDMDLSYCALGFAALMQPGMSVDKYINHLNKMTQTISDWMEEVLSEGAEDNLETRIDVLTKVIHHEFEYQDPKKNESHIDNMNMMRVIDQRCGGAEALGILYLHVAKKLGWDMAGLNFPKHFIVRLSYKGDTVILNPSCLGMSLSAPELRFILKSSLGKYAELSHNYYETIDNRDILIRLENSLKTRLIEMGSYKDAIDVIEVALLIAPKEYRLLLDIGVLKSKIGQVDQAITHLQNYIKQSPNINERNDAEILLQELQNSLH